MTRPIDEKVVIAYLHPGLVHAAFMESVVDLLVYDIAFHKRIVQGGGRLATQSGANLSGPRNGLIRQFLDYGKADWLWMVDTDMTFRPDTIERLLEHADPEQAPIVGGLCFGFDDATRSDVPGRRDRRGVPAPPPHRAGTDPRRGTAGP